MRIVAILTALLLSVFMGTAMAYGLEAPQVAFITVPTIFTISMVVPMPGGILAVNYVMVNVDKPDVATPGYQPQKDKITIFRARDVSIFPSRDSKGIKITNNIVMKSGTNMITLDITEGTLDWKGAAEGDADSRAIIQELNGEVPGYRLELAEFVQNNLNENLYAIIEFCNGDTPLLFGSECSKMQMTPEMAGNKDKTFGKISLKSMKKGPAIAHYYGTMTYAVDFNIAADDVTPSIAKGSGRYVIPSNNAAAVTVTGFDDAVAGDRITLVGSGGTHVSTLANGTTFILEGGADWDSDLGSTLTLQVFDATHFYEISRS